MKLKPLFFWLLWLVVIFSISGYYLYRIYLSEDKTDLLIGETTYGHYQIEMQCTACHTEAFGGTEILQNACLNCHESELNDAHDSHPRKKFTDPRNADRLEIIDARYCIACHTEHQTDQTHAMGVTLPDDYCFHCHENVYEERPSHVGAEFDSCASAGCHNYHDNRALYERFLVENSGKANVLDTPERSIAAHASQDAVRYIQQLAENIEQRTAHSEIVNIEHETRHAQAGVSCESCHQPSGTENWIDKPGIEQCATCHQYEVDGFKQSKHGMRIAQGLSAVTPSDARIQFKTDALHTPHGCNSCHEAHEFDRVKASVDSCLSCHDDTHSSNFLESPHGKLHTAFVEGSLPEEKSVSCATCHLPNEAHNKAGTNFAKTNHNVNNNLRPNEKMIRPVCLSCHSLEFSIDALADEDLIKSNFTGKPAKHIESVDWALDANK